MKRRSPRTLARTSLIRKLLKNPLQMGLWSIYALWATPPNGRKLKVRCSTGQSNWPDVIWEKGPPSTLASGFNLIDAILDQHPRGGDTDRLCQEEEERETERNRKVVQYCLLYTSPSPRDGLLSRMP